jgi:hypothetical protein
MFGAPYYFARGRSQVKGVSRREGGTRTSVEYGGKAHQRARTQSRQVFFKSLVNKFHSENISLILFVVPISTDK